MFDVISAIFGLETVAAGSNAEMVILACCGVLTVLLTVVFIDLFYRLFSHFWGQK